jgi:tRNA (guanine-N7-)-methyltransferase
VAQKTPQQTQNSQYRILNLIAKKIKNDGFVHMATDWEEYAFEMLEEFSKHSSFKNTTNEFSEKPTRRPTTKFERRGQKLGHGVWDLVFIKS